MVAALPESETSTGKKLVEKSRKYGGLAARAFLRVALRQGAEEIIDAAAGEAVEALEGSDKALQEATKEFGDGISKAAGDLVASQVAAERLRNDELPAQLSALRDALTSDTPNRRIVVLADELDRCHPDYAIAFLEAMKLVFAHEGFVFCLLVNADYLEGLASHRFGKLGDGERYLEKFVDIQLKLPMGNEALSAAAQELASTLPLAIPYGENPEFSVERAADLAGKLAPISGLSMRQIKRVLLKVELALRCYSDRPLDCALLVFLAFRGAAAGRIEGSLFPRATLSPSFQNKFKAKRASMEDESRIQHQASEFVHKSFPELLKLPADRYRSPPIGAGRVYHDWVPVVWHLSRHYLPEHQAVLDGVHQFEPGAL